MFRDGVTVFLAGARRMRVVNRSCELELRDANQAIQNENISNSS